jgi:small subunit ribosomal protein S6
VNAYEVIFIVDPALTEEGVESEIEAVRATIAKKGGEVLEVQKWGKKRLAYEIKRRRDGHYIFMKVHAPAGMAAELQRQFRIAETVLRGMVLRVERPRKSRFKAKPLRSREAAMAGAREVHDG